VPCRKTGFTLLELSVVLVIIGLIVGGVVAGNELIHNARLSNVLKEVGTFKIAFDSFHSQYNAVPGDMANATDYWGALDSGDGEGSDCFTLEATGTETCNGNGDGNINTPTGGTGVWIYGERFTFWQHLANAQLIGGKYTGRTDSTTNNYVVTAGKNSPGSDVEGGIWTPYMLSNYPDNAYHFAYTSPWRLQLTYRSSSTINRSPLSAEEAYWVDLKGDDGRPGTGDIRTAKNSWASAPGCASTDVASTAEYAITYTTNPCLMWFYVE